MNVYMYTSRARGRGCFFVHKSGPLSRTADMRESSTGNANRQEFILRKGYGHRAAAHVFAAATWVDQFVVHESCVVAPCSSRGIL